MVQAGHKGVKSGSVPSISGRQPRPSLSLIVPAIIDYFSTGRISVSSTMSAAGAGGAAVASLPLFLLRRIGSFNNQEKHKSDDEKIDHRRESCHTCTKHGQVFQFTEVCGVQRRLKHKRGNDVTDKRPTMLLNAPPMITPTASSTTFPRITKALNSFSIAERFRLFRLIFLIDSGCVKNITSCR